MAIRPQSTVTLRLSRILQAPRPAVFHAWTRPEALKQWMAPGELVVTLAEADLRPGGRFRIHMREPNGTEHRMGGTYVEVKEPSRLVFSWIVETDPVPANTRVTVEFHPRRGGTEVMILHELFPSDEMCALHEQGWNGCLDKLPGVLDGGEH